MDDRLQLAIDTGTTEYYYDGLRRDHQDILSLEQVAHWFDVSQRTITRLVEEGELVGFHVGRSWRFQRADVDEYIERQRTKEHSPLDRVRAEAQRYPEKIPEMIEILSQLM